MLKRLKANMEKKSKNRNNKSISLHIHYQKCIKPFGLRSKTCKILN